MSRRKFSQASIALAIGATGIAKAGEILQVQEQDPVNDWRHPANNGPDPAAKGLTAYLDHGNLFVRYENKALLNYRAYQTLKYPYFEPMNGPLSGLPLTTESSLPYPHHRGLWLGCQPLDGGDYWGATNINTGHISSVDLKLIEDGKDGIVSFSDYCKWIREGADSPFEDRRMFKVHSVEKNIRILDCQLSITALKDISIGRAKHSFFALRCAPDIAPTYGGTLMNSEGGIGAEGTYGKPTRWCTYFGPRSFNPKIIEGIAVMNHPKNFGGKTLWLTRDYGHLSPQPFMFNKEPFRISKGETLELRYRIVLYAGTPKEAKLEALYEKWI